MAAAAMVFLSLLFLSLLPLLSPASACSLAVGGCLSSRCAQLKENLMSPQSTSVSPYLWPKWDGPNHKGDPVLGFWMGIANNATNTSSARGSAIVNWEIFPNIGVGPEQGLVVKNTTATSLENCCNICAQTTGCALYQYFHTTVLANAYDAFGKKGLSTTRWPNGFVAGMNCYLLSGGSYSESVNAPGVGYPEGKTISSPWTPNHGSMVGDIPYKYMVPSWVGGLCNPTGGVTGDPHFTGARGTKFEFNGEIDRTFALIADRRLHVNIKLGGYEDSRTAGATVVRNGKGLRTWIREVGIVWLADDGSKHSLVLKARTGTAVYLNKGYLEKVTMDGYEVPSPSHVNKMELTAYGLSLFPLTPRKWGSHDVESFKLVVDGHLEAILDLRPAHPLLQTPEDAWVHFSVAVKDLKFTNGVHGVLGQTFRQTSAQMGRAVEYGLLSKLLMGPVVADGENGRGFLDGVPLDYEVPSIVDTSFKFSSFGKVAAL